MNNDWRIGVTSVENSVENFKGLHNVGKTFDCAAQAGTNKDENCNSCYLAAMDCLGNQSCVNETMCNCVNDNSCSVSARINTPARCGNLSTN